MTNPFDPNSENNSSPNGFGGGVNNNGGLPRYEPTNHPEDQAGFGQPGGYGSNEGFGGSAYGGSSSGSDSYGVGQDYGGYGAYNAGQEGYAGAGYGDDSSYSGPGPQAGPAYTGPVSAVEAIKWGFKATLKNPLLWILGAVVVGLIQLVSQAGVNAAQNAEGDGVSVVFDLLSFVTSILSLVIGLVVYRLAYREIDTPKPTWGTLFHGVRWVQPLVVGLVLGLLGALAIFVVVLIAILVGFGSLEGLDVQNVDELSEGQMMTLVGSVLGLLFVVFLVALFIQPFFVLMPWLAADTSSIGEAFSKGLKLGKDNYGHLLLLMVLSGLLFAASIITLGLALVVIAPAMQLATAHLCRQCQGRYAPAVQ